MKTFLTTWSDKSEVWIKGESIRVATAYAMLIWSTNKKRLVGVHERQHKDPPTLNWECSCGVKYMVGRM